jgi:hypothetical protein
MAPGILCLYRIDDYESTLKEVSSSNDCQASMIDDETVVVYNFDRMSAAIKGLRGDEQLASCDALYESDGEIYLIEFKNQPSRNIKTNDIQRKLFDSLAQLLVVWRKSVSCEELSGKIHAYVVFNNGGKDVSFEAIRNKNYTLAYPTTPDEPVLFDLRSKLSLLFKEIHTVDIGRFNDVYRDRIFAS